MVQKNALLILMLLKVVSFNLDIQDMRDQFKHLDVLKMQSLVMVHQQNNVIQDII